MTAISSRSSPATSSSTAPPPSPRSTRSRGRSCRRESPRGHGPSGSPPSAGSRPGCAPSIPPRRSRPRGVFPGYGRRPAPFIFTDGGIARMHAACGSLRPWFRSATYTALFGLVAVTGIRIGEALAIPAGGIDLDAGLLPVHPAKSRCERILPLHPTTVAALAEYEELRARKHPKATTFFVSIRGTRLCHHPVLNAFREACALAGIPGRPRIHDLRHYADGWVMRPAVTFPLAGAAELVLQSA